jgi:hypothetical protein
MSKFQVQPVGWIDGEMTLTETRVDAGILEMRICDVKGETETPAAIMTDVSIDDEMTVAPVNMKDLIIARTFVEPKATLQEATVVMIFLEIIELDIAVHSE